MKYFTPFAKIISSFVIFSFLYFSSIDSSFAQVNFTVGTGTAVNSTTGYPCPLGNWYKGLREQYIFTAAELSNLGMSSGLISNVAWQVMATNGCGLLTNYTIYLQHTTASTISTWQSINSAPAYQASYQPVVGWNDFSLTNPFNWNGTDNILMQVCYTNTSPYTYNPSIPYHTTSAPQELTYRSDVTPSMCTVTSISFNYSTRPNTRFTLLAAISKNDAGVEGLDSPNSSCEGTQSIVARVKNFGLNQIDSVTVNWMLNGALQTPVVYQQLIDTMNGNGPNTASIPLGSINLVWGKKDTIVVWTTLPNNVTDTVTWNDSLVEIVHPALGGAYTIDKFGSGPRNYTSFPKAIDDLSEFGVCSPTTFKVFAKRYGIQIKFKGIPGASATNPVKFKVDSGMALIEQEPVASRNYIIQYNNTHHVTFENFIIQADSNSKNYGRVIDFNESSSYNTFINCELNGVEVGKLPTTIDQAVIYADGIGLDHNEFYDTKIQEGSIGIYYVGDGPTSLNEGLVFDGCDVLNNYYYGTVFDYTSDLRFTNGSVKSSYVYVNSNYGLYATNTYGIAEIMANDIDWPVTYAFYMTNTNGNSSEYALIANNMIKSGAGAASSSSYGMYTDGDYMRIIHNTIYSRNGAGMGYHGLYVNGSNNMTQNNIVYAPNGSSTYYGLYFTSGSVTTSDYNAVYTPNHQFGYSSGAYSTLAAWRSGTGLDMNSSTTNPSFYKFEPMRSCNSTLESGGKPLSYITHDFDGDPRISNNPDIGADEWVGTTPGSFNAGPDAVVCDGKTADIGTSASEASFAWSNGDTNAVITVDQAGTYIVTISPNCGGSHTDTVEVVERTPVADFTSSANGRTVNYSNTSLEGDTFMWVINTPPENDTIWTKDLNYQFPSNGPFTVTLFVMNNCDTVSTSEEFITYLGYENTSLDKSISVMPNPTSDIVHINFGNTDTENLNIELTDIKGQLVYSERLTNVGKSSRKTIDVSHLNKGMYILRFTTAEDVATKRLIVK